MGSYFVALFAVANTNPCKRRNFSLVHKALRHISAFSSTLPEKFHALRKAFSVGCSFLCFTQVVSFFFALPSCNINVCLLSPSISLFCFYAIHLNSICRKSKNFCQAFSSYFRFDKTQSKPRFSRFSRRTSRPLTLSSSGRFLFPGPFLKLLTAGSSLSYYD